MAISEGDGDIDPVYQNIKAIEELITARNMAEFDRAMQDPEGFVPVRLVEDRRRMDNEAHQEEINRLRAMLKKADELKSPTRLIGHEARLRTELLQKAMTN